MDFQEKMSITFFVVGCVLGFGAYGFKKAQELARERKTMKPTLTTPPQDPSAAPAVQATSEVTEDLPANTVPPTETAATPVKRRSRFHADTALTSSPADPSPSPPTRATLEVTEDPMASSVPPAEPAAPPAKGRSQFPTSIACPNVDMKNAHTSAPHRGSLSKLILHVPTLRNPWHLPSPIVTRKTRPALTSIPIIEVPEEDVLTVAVGDVFVPIKACPGQEDTRRAGTPSHLHFHFLTRPAASETECVYEFKSASQVIQVPPFLRHRFHHPHRRPKNSHREYQYLHRLQAPSPPRIRPQAPTTVTPNRPSLFPAPS